MYQRPAHMNGHRMHADEQADAAADPLEHPGEEIHDRIKHGLPTLQLKTFRTSYAEQSAAAINR